MALTQVDQGLLSSTAQYTGFKNRIINGAMVIDQRNAGAAQTITTAGGNQYTVDRWFASCTGANVTGQRVAGTGANAYNYRFTGAASVTNIYFQQRIESVNMIDLVGSTVTLSVNLANSVLTTVNWVANYPNSTDNYGGGFTAISSGSFTVNSTLTQYTTQISVPAGATTGLQIYFYVGAQTSGTWTIGNVQLEKGSTATSFDYRPYGTELALCQRYLPAFYGIYNQFAGIASSTTQAYATVNFPVTARVAPTGLVVNAASAFNVTDITAQNAAASAISFNVAGVQSAQILATSTSLTANRPTNIFSNSATSNLYFTGCEL